ncbi:hypothetical protein [Streptomyces sodiiphilus]|uniref:hypothetical protein n=1 Tax=Streptomyces sodiiphilus TaxID=226217 RepID=UPI0031E431D0
MPPAPRSRPRLVAAVTCLVLGTGLLGGAAAGAWLSGPGTDLPGAEEVFDEGRMLWRELPVDDIFPPELTGEGAGPGGADRRWIRVAVAPDSDCADAFDPLLSEVLSPAGCHRLLRASYLDDTESSVITVGLLFTRADPAGMSALRERFRAQSLDERTDLLPRPYAPEGTAAEGFGDAQRAAWTVRVLTDIPVVTYAVAGFADGRPVPGPQPADRAAEDGQDSSVALAGLGHDATGVADRVERRLRKAADRTVAERS